MCLHTLLLFYKECQHSTSSPWGGPLWIPPIHCAALNRTLEWFHGQPSRYPQPIPLRTPKPCAVVWGTLERKGNVMRRTFDGICHNCIAHRYEEACEEGGWFEPNVLRQGPVDIPPGSELVRSAALSHRPSDFTSVDTTKDSASPDGTVVDSKETNLHVTPKSSLCLRDGTDKIEGSTRSNLALCRPGWKPSSEIDLAQKLVELGMEKLGERAHVARESPPQHFNSHPSLFGPTWAHAVDWMEAASRAGNAMMTNWKDVRIPLSA